MLGDDEILDAIFCRQGIALQESRGESIPESLLIVVKQIEMDAMGLAESGDYSGALDGFTRAIDSCPKYASAYNNRAQVYRLMGDFENALQDLDKAIEFGNPSILKQAYTQRAIVFKKMGREDEAELDFQKGAQYGNQVAQQVVKDNPFARL